jgi:hypothetical protein
VKLVYNELHGRYQWRLDNFVSSPEFDKKSEAQFWYSALLNHFTSETLNKKNLPRLLTKF